MGDNVVSTWSHMWCERRIPQALRADRSTSERSVTTMTEASGFSGFRAATFEFLDQLRDNNDPAWFKPRKAVYEAEVLAPLRDLIIAVVAALRRGGLPLGGDPRRSIFRI